MRNQVAINDLGRHAASTQCAVHEAVERVLMSGWYILGREGEAFEREFADYCGATDCVAVANGTDAIELGLRALGVGKGDRVATVANAGLYTTTALIALGAEPVFVDVNYETRLMDLEHLEKVLANHDISAVVVTHLFGLLHDMQAVLRITSATGVPVLKTVLRRMEQAAAANERAALAQPLALAFIRPRI